MTNETRRRLRRYNLLLRDKGDSEKLREAARDLWTCPSYESDLGEASDRDAYVDALFDLGVLYRGSPSLAASVLKRAYSLDDGRVRRDRGSSAKEAAAYKLGGVYEKASCFNSAAWWHRRSLDSARSAGVKENLILNLQALARNLNTLGRHDEAKTTYDELLQLVGELPLSEQVSAGLAHAAMHDLQHGDTARGEAIMRALSADALRERSVHFGASPIPVWFAAAQHALGFHHIASARPEEALGLAREVVGNARRYESPDAVCYAMQGLAAKALLHRGELDASLAELEKVHQVNSTNVGLYEVRLDPSTLEQWLDVARIHVARNRMSAAMAAYKTLAYNLGVLVFDRSHGSTTRLRMHWLEKMAFVVHEMASAWLEIEEPKLRGAMEPAIGHALLQLKANLLTAIDTGKNVKTLQLTEAVFAANRRYAEAARRLTVQRDQVDVLLELEEALLEREELEQVVLPFAENQLSPPRLIGRIFGLSTPAEEAASLAWSRGEAPSPAATLLATLVGDVRQLVKDDGVYVDYTVIRFQPPRQGRVGPPNGHRYLGVRIDREAMKVHDLGHAHEIDAQCGAFVDACSAPGIVAEPSGGESPTVRHLSRSRPTKRLGGLELDRLAGDLYDRVVAPFEPLGRSLIVSVDGLLATAPFHALLRDGRWLVETTAVTYCHSLHVREKLYQRQYNPETRHLPPVEKVALLIGNPAYEAGGLTLLPGTQVEISGLAELLANAKFGDGEKAFDEVRVRTGPEATGSQLVGATLPRVIHIAAHGSFSHEQLGRPEKRPLRFGEYYRVWDELAAAPMSALDGGLLRCGLHLAGEHGASGARGGSTVVTALELSSLNFLGCHAVILSACETGKGTSLYGAGALSFQFAVQAMSARSGLVSLWKVLDRETATFMIDFYKELLSFRTRDVGASYLSTMRQHCRRDGRRVHPYFWAAFAFIDNEYENPMPW